MRKPCTPENPSDGKPYEWYHPYAKLIREEYDTSANHNDYAIYECPICGLEFETTIPN
jgi:hypothetical protein